MPAEGHNYPINTLSTLTHTLYGLQPLPQLLCSTGLLFREFTTCGGCFFLKNPWSVPITLSWSSLHPELFWVGIQSCSLINLLKVSAYNIICQVLSTWVQDSTKSLQSVSLESHSLLTSPPDPCRISFWGPQEERAEHSVGPQAWQSGLKSRQRRPELGPSQNTTQLPLLVISKHQGSP